MIPAPMSVPLPEYSVLVSQIYVWAVRWPCIWCNKIFDDTKGGQTIAELLWSSVGDWPNAAES